MSVHFKKSVFRRRLWITGVCFLLILCGALLAVSLYIDQSFEKAVDAELFSDAGIVRSPRFYIYDFDSRYDRVGERKEVTDTFFAQKQTVFVPLEEVPKALQNRKR